MANYSTDPNQLGAWPANHMPNVAGVPWLFSTLPLISNLSKGVTAYTLDLGTCVWNGTAWAQISNPDNTSPRNILTETDGASNAKIWDLFVDGGCFFGRTRTDADGAGKNWLAVTRSGTTLTQIDLGNGVDNPLTVIHGNLQSTQIAILSGGSVSYASSFSVATGQATDVGWWVSGASGSNWFLNTAADGYGAGRNVIVAARGAGVGITSLSFGNSSDNPNFNFLGTGAVTVSGSLAITGNVGFYGTAVAAKPTVTGSRGSNAALASLLTALAGLGLLTDSSS